MPLIPHIPHRYVATSNTENLDRISVIMLPDFKRPDTTFRCLAILAVFQAVAIVEKRKPPSINLAWHKAVIDLTP